MSRPAWFKRPSPGWGRVTGIRPEQADTPKMHEGRRDERATASESSAPSARRPRGNGARRDAREGRRDERASIRPGPAQRGPLRRRGRPDATLRDAGNQPADGLLTAVGTRPVHRTGRASRRPPGRPGLRPSRRSEDRIRWTSSTSSSTPPVKRHSRTGAAWVALVVAAVVMIFLLTPSTCRTRTRCRCATSASRAPCTSAWRWASPPSAGALTAGLLGTVRILQLRARARRSH